MPDLNLPLGSNPGEYGWDGTERLINGYMRVQEDSSGKHGILVASDGLNLFATPSVPSTYGVRAMLATDQFLFAIVGSSVIAITSRGTCTTIGSIPGNGIPIYMVRNRRDPAQIGIVDSGGSYYVITEGATPSLAQVTDSDYFPATSIAFMNGYFILPGNNGRWAITGEDNATSIDGLEFAFANSDADQIVRAATRDDLVVLFGEVTTQFYRDVGAPDFPFEPVQTSQMGCFAPMSVATVSGTLAWVDQTREGGKMVRLMDGYYGNVISTPSVERFLDKITDRNELQAFAWSRRGHTFYALSGNNGTWVYDVKTQQWHERQSYGLNRWRASCHAIFQGKHYVGHYASNKIYEMSPDFEDEEGDPLVMTVQTANNPGRMIYNNIQIEALPGVGLNTTTPADLDPVLMMDWSDDGGNAWSQQRQLALGRQGKTGVILNSYRMGTSSTQGRSYRFSISANVAKMIRRVQVNEDFRAR